MEVSLKELHEQVLYTQVRIIVKGSKGAVGGSGTIIYSKEGKRGYSTYVLTCYHVIEEAISVRKEYDPKIGRDRKFEYRQVVTVELFDYKSVPHGRRPVSSSVDADIVAYDKTHDLALLKLRTVNKMPYVANLLPLEAESKLVIGTPCYAVGCALLHDPILTQGIITHIGDEIDYKDYWMSSAQIIFGNSGGAVFVFLDGKYYFVGVPSRIDIVGWGSPVTHLGYFTPVHRVYEFLKEQMFDFIYDSKKTEEECEAERRKIKEAAEKRVLVAVESEDEGEDE